MNKSKPRYVRWVGCLALMALIGAACTSDNNDDPGAATDQGIIEVEAAALQDDVLAGQVTIAEGETHDGDVTIDPDTGRIYTIWAQDTGEKPNKITGDPPQDILVAYSDDDGQTWSEPTRVNDKAGTGNTGFNSQARIVALGNNEVFVTWPSKVAGDHHAAYYVMGDRSTDGGDTWGKDRSIATADKTHNSEGYGAIANSGKNVYAAFLDYRESRGPNMPIGVGFVQSKNGGKSFSPSGRAVLRSCECCDNAVAVDSKGTIYIAFRTQESHGTHTTIRDSAVVRSYDGGQTWSDPVYMGRDRWVFNGCPEGGPELTVGEGDILHGVYWTGKEGAAGVYYTTSTDGGRSFADPLPVATDDFYPPAYVDLTEGPDGAAWLVWDDRREADKKVHLGRVIDGELSVLDSFSAGVTPAIHGTADSAVMVWSDGSGLQFAQLDASA